MSRDPQGCWAWSRGPEVGSQPWCPVWVEAGLTHPILLSCDAGEGQQSELSPFLGKIRWCWALFTGKITAQNTLQAAPRGRLPGERPQHKDVGRLLMVRTRGEWAARAERGLVPRSCPVEGLAEPTPRGAHLSAGPGERPGRWPKKQDCPGEGYSLSPAPKWGRAIPLLPAKCSHPGSTSRLWPNSGAPWARLEQSDIRIALNLDLQSELFYWPKVTRKQGDTWAGKELQPSRGRMALETPWPPHLKPTGQGPLSMQGSLCRCNVRSQPGCKLFSLHSHVESLLKPTKTGIWEIQIHLADVWMEQCGFSV